MNLSIQDELQRFSEELYHHLTPFSFGRTRKRIRFCKKKTEVFRKLISYHMYLGKSTYSA